MIRFDYFAIATALVAVVVVVFCAKNVIDIISEQQFELKLRRWEDMRTYLLTAAVMLYTTVLVGAFDWGLHLGTTTRHGRLVFDYPQFWGTIVVATLIILPFGAVLSYWLSGRYAPKRETRTRRSRPHRAV